MLEPKKLTSTRAEEIRIELLKLKGPDRAEISARLRSAIQMGDLSENADYHKAKEDQAFLEGRIQELESLIKTAIIVDTSEVSRDRVDVGVTVTVQEEDYPPDTYHMVGASEADLRKRKISNESPIGKALMGGREGDVVIAETPNGQVQLKILKIE